MLNTYIQSRLPLPVPQTPPQQGLTNLEPIHSDYTAKPKPVARLGEGVTCVSTA